MAAIKKLFGGIFPNAAWDAIKQGWDFIPAGWKSVIVTLLTTALTRFYEWYHGALPADAWLYALIYGAIALIIANELRRAGPYFTRGGYDKAHDKRQTFELYEAACLWRNEEPNPNFNIGSPTNAIFNLLQETLQDESLEIDFKQSYDLHTYLEEEKRSMRNLPVTRETLEALAVYLAEKPTFLFGRAARRAKANRSIYETPASPH